MGKNSSEKGQLMRKRQSHGSRFPLCRFLRSQNLKVVSKENLNQRGGMPEYLGRTLWEGRREQWYTNAVNLRVGERAQ